MKAVVSLFLVFALAFPAVLPSYAEPRQIVQGTEIHLTLLTPVSSTISREGDPFIAVLAQPVAIDSRIILPAGTRLHGVVGTIQKAKNFSVFRGQAYLNLMFKTAKMQSSLHAPVSLDGVPGSVNYWSKQPGAFDKEKHLALRAVAQAVVRGQQP